jgi:hypothetical protein
MESTVLGSTAHRAERPGPLAVRLDEPRNAHPDTPKSLWVVAVSDVPELHPHEAQVRPAVFVVEV